MRESYSGGENYEESYAMLLMNLFESVPVMAAGTVNDVRTIVVYGGMKFREE